MLVLLLFQRFIDSVQKEDPHDKHIHLFIITEGSRDLDPLLASVV